MNYWTQWSFDPGILAAIAVAGILYWRGRRRLNEVRRGHPLNGWRVASFYTGLGVAVVALESPIDTLGAVLFSFHMIQHLLLIMVAAPLILLGDPGVTMMRGVPLSVRRAVLGRGARQGWLHRIGALTGRINQPVPAAAIFVGVLYVWHWNVLWNLTLENDVVHAIEHVCFLLTALLLWTQVIDQRALHPRLTDFQRAIYTVLVGSLGNFLAMYFVFAAKPLYSYAQEIHRPFGMTALGDQQIAGAIMWVPVLLLFSGAFAVFMYRGLAEDAQHADAVPPSGPQYTLLPRRADSMGGHHG
jgi:cytochrome c oxidase assembly factor CtaG